MGEDLRDASIGSRHWLGVSEFDNPNSSLDSDQTKNTNFPSLMKNEARYETRNSYEDERTCYGELTIKTTDIDGVVGSADAAYYATRYVDFEAKIVR
jgi:hypothetical protein